MNPKQVSGLSSIKLDVSIDSVARYFGGNNYIADKKTIDRIHRAINEASSLINPRATYTLCSVSEMKPGEKMILENGQRLSLPECIADPGARLVAASVGTLGGKLEKQCRKLAGSGQIYESILLDAVGTAILDRLGEIIYKTIEKDISRIGLVGGVRFAPGLEGYPLEQQRMLFQIADNESVGVVLNSSDIMMPTKSISFFLMLTTTILRSKKTDKCSSCRLVGCRYRTIKKADNLSGGI